MKVRILVSGGRTFGALPNVPFEPPYSGYAEAVIKAEAEKELFFKVMEAAKKKYEIECIIEGGARGADRLAQKWAKLNNIPLITCKADWDTHGKKAGILRNQSMLDEHAPTLTVAFPGGDGTKDMVRRSIKAGIKTIEVPN
jgi:hypothetical protein